MEAMPHECGFFRGVRMLKLDQTLLRSFHTAVQKPRRKRLKGIKSLSTTKTVVALTSLAVFLLASCHVWHVEVEDNLSVWRWKVLSKTLHQCRFAFVGAHQQQTKTSLVLRRAGSDANPWHVLGVSSGASDAEIKKAYRRRALKEHPDVSKAPDAKQRWQELSQAYDILSDPQKRRAWEMRQQTSGTRSSARSRTRSSSSANYGQRRPRTSAFEEEEDDETGGDSFGAIFSDFLKGVGEEAGGVRGSVRKARKVGAYVLEDLLEYLEQGIKDDMKANPNDSRPPEADLQEAREEFSTLRQREAVVQTEADAWKRKAELCEGSGDRAGEIEAMRNAFDARERLAKISRRVLRASERVNYLEKVVFEVSRRQQQSSGEGEPTQRSRTSQAPPKQPSFNADRALEDLKRKKGVR